MILSTKSFAVEPLVEHSSYKWVTMMIAITATMFSSISRQSFGILYAELLLVAPSVQVTWIFNVHQFLSDSTGLFMGPLCEELGYRLIFGLGGLLMSGGIIASAFVHSATYLFFTFSVLTGLGSGIVIYVSYVKVPEFFLTQQGLATSLLYAGSSMGQLIGPLLVTMLQIQTGYFWTILLLGTFFLNVCPLSVLFHPAKDHELPTNLRKMSSVYTISYTTEELKVTRPRCIESLEPNCEKKIDVPVASFDDRLVKFLRGFVENFILVKSPSVVIISTSLAIVSMTYSNFLMYIPFAMNAAGASLEEASVSLTVASFSMVLGRLVIPGIYDFVSISSEWYFKIGALFMSISMFAFTLFEDQVISYACLLVFGLTVGCTSSFRPLLCIEILGIERLPGLYAVNGVQTSLFYLIGGAGLGAFAHAFGDYILLIRVLSSVTIISFLLWLLMPCAKAYDRRRGFIK